MKHLELFDSVGLDVRPMIRDERDYKKRASLSIDPIINMTLEEYAQYMVCGKLFVELSEQEIRTIGSGISYMVGWERTFLSYDDDINNLIERIRERIQDTIDLYHETKGLYGTGGRFVYRRRIEEAVKLGIDVPDRVKNQDWM